MYYFRIISDMEIQEIVKFHQRIFNCEYSKLPVALFGNIHNRKSSLRLRNIGVKSESVNQCSQLLTGVCTAASVIKQNPVTTNVGHAIKHHCMTKIWAEFEGKHLQVDSEKESQPFSHYALCYEKIKKSFLEIGNERLVNNCRRATIQSVKNIRLTMDIIKHLMMEIPDLNLVYYIRDPRGIISSRLQGDGLLTFKPLAETKLLCSRMAQDILNFRIIQKDMPSRVILQKYEDFAKDPETEIKKTYNFLKEQVPVDVIEWVQKASSSVRDKAKTKVKWAFGTLRKNSTDVSIAWRRKLPESLIDQLTDICFEVLQKLNYEL